MHDSGNEAVHSFMEKNTRNRYVKPFRIFWQK